MARPEIDRELTVGGIDPNSHRIVIVSTRRRDKVKPFIFAKELTGDYSAKTSQAFDFIFEYCMGVVEYDERPPRLFLEEPVMGVGGPGATIPQAFISGAIMAGAYQAGAVITMVNNSTWKKRVVGNGNSNKLAVSMFVEEKWPLLYQKCKPMTASQTGGKPELVGRGDQDVVDAGCINLHGWRHIKMIEKIKERRNGQ